MTTILDADSLAPDDRAEAIRTLIWDAVVRVEIEHHPDPARIHAQDQVSDLGRLTLCSIRSNATTVTRTPALAHDPIDPYLFVGLQISGSSMVLQNGREAVLRPGDLAVYDTRLPYTLVNDSGIHQHFFRFPISALGLSAALIGEVSAVRLDGTRPLARITAAHLRALAADAAQLGGREAEVAAESSLVLVRALLAAQLADRPEAAELIDRSLEQRIVQYMGAHLRESDLSASRIAHEHHVSVRHLYRLLARRGIVLGEWLRQQRLAGCRQALGDPGDTRTIMAIAHEWGFVDVTHFGRGRTPSLTRRTGSTARTPPSPSSSRCRIVATR